MTTLGVKRSTNFGPNVKVDLADEVLTLRDYFAIRIAAAVVTHGDLPDNQLPRVAYELADALIAERAK